MYLGYEKTDLSPGARLLRDLFIGIAAILGIVMAGWRNFALDRQSKAAQEQAKIGNQQAQHDRDRIAGEQFSNAVKLLAQKDAKNKPAIDARIGGIYSLQTLANNRIEKYGAQVVKTLIAYIKQNAQPLLPKETRASDKFLSNLVMGPSPDSGVMNARSPQEARDMEEDVKAAFKVLEQLLADREKDSTEWDKAHTGVQLLGEDLNFSGSNFSWLDMSGIPISRLYRYKWNGVNMQGARLAFANLQNANLTFANLQNADLWLANLQNAKLSRARLQGANLTEANLENAGLVSANLQSANLAYAILQNAGLVSANLQSANLTEANLHNANLNSAILQGARLKMAILQNAILMTANLEGVVLARAKLERANLRSAKMQGADLGDAIMQNANLTHAQLQGASLLEADLRGANLSEADLQYADLSYAELDDKTVLPGNLSGKIWHFGQPKLSDIIPLPWDAEWDLSPFSHSGYALVGVLRNFALPHGIAHAKNERVMRAKKLRLAARKLLDEKKLSEDFPKDWRDWLAEVKPDGSHPNDPKRLD